MEIPEIRLNDGSLLPAIGLGIGIIHYPGSRNLLGRVYHRFVTKRTLSRNCQAAIESAIEAGYRLIDTSAAYNNLSEISKAISRYDRAEIKIQSRVSNKAQFSGTVKEEFYRSLESMKCDYIDILQLHWPVPRLFLSSWEIINELHAEGLVKSVGVANFNIHHLEDLSASSSVIPAVNQIEIHPLFSNKDLAHYCQSKGIIVEAYTPLARMDDRLLKSSRLSKIASAHHTSIASIILRWHYQNSIIPIVKSQNPIRQRANLSIFNFSLSDEEMRTIDSVNINARRRFDPDNCDFENL